MPPQPPQGGVRAFAKSSNIRTAVIAVVAIGFILVAIYVSYLILAAPIPDTPPATTETSQSSQDAASQDTDRELAIAQMRAEARRNALAAGAGFVAIAGLILALRRQQHHERSTANTEDDALQRRITDARIRAVEQLGSDNPAVRIGGLHNLERIGQQHTDLRQVVLDEICSYLRLPYTPTSTEPSAPLPARQFEPVGPPPAEATTDEGEREVRLIAQEIMQRHLNPNREDLYWEHSRLNLRNARLDNLLFRGCHLTWADFINVTFGGGADFGGASFEGGADFGGASFEGGADFRDVTFGGADFGGVTFTSAAFFQSATFTGGADFWDVTFTSAAFFRDVTFGGGADFRDATFTSATYFWDVTFGGGADFRGATFSADAVFRGATFTGDADFWDVTFTGDAHFQLASFEGGANFWGSTFTGHTVLQGATFTGDAHFQLASFEGGADFRDVTFDSIMVFRGATFLETVPHQFPDGWVLEPIPTDPRRSRLIRTAETPPPAAP